MMKVSEYQQSLIIDALKKIEIARKSLLDINHNFAFVDCCELQFETINSCNLLLESVSKSLSGLEIQE